MIKNFAIVENGVVVNIAVSERALAANWIESDIAQIGWTYNGSTFYGPQQPAPQAPPAFITKIAFVSRMTDLEYVGILTAGKTDIAVEAWVNKFNMVTQIDLSDQRTIDGINLLVSKNLLTQARATSILTAPVQQSERP